MDEPNSRAVALVVVAELVLDSGHSDEGAVKRTLVLKVAFALVTPRPSV